MSKDAENSEEMTDSNDTSSESETSGNGIADGLADKAEAAAASQSAELEALRGERDDAKKEQLYLRAEFDNYRKRVIKEQSDLRKYASEPLLVAILDVMDNFQRALDTDVNEGNFKDFEKGVRMISDELNQLIQRFGVQEIEGLGKDFDPNFFEALASEESEEASPGSIVRIFRRAYKLHDRIIRPGQVVVAKEPSKKDS
ncbi:MAG: nucleotide exchange factor GrpE [Bdellovibrionales bacterium CG10_big_fil_rev_8_21_14_0_10_45_34]|nr:MAG: nucleotide exchange factor GrpE [Bdellovibrionales bacterium CG10_big_fil_rev_8_21_14_0_10_45_34]